MSNYLVNSTDLTSVADAIRAKSGGSSSLEFPTDFVSEIGSIPSGGGGNNLIASGTFSPAYTNKTTSFAVGTKMPKKDFCIIIKAPNDTEYLSDSYQRVFYNIFIIDGTICSFDFSSDGTLSPSFYNNTFSINNNGNISYKTSPTTNDGFYTGYVGVSSTASSNGGSQGNVKVIKDSSGFSLNLTLPGNYGRYSSDITYSWHIRYFGSDPANDIVEVSV